MTSAPGRWTRSLGTPYTHTHIPTHPHTHTHTHTHPHTHTNILFMYQAYKCSTLKSAHVFSVCLSVHIHALYYFT